jgi:hypothetical protein
MAGAAEVEEFVLKYVTSYAFRVRVCHFQRGSQTGSGSKASEAGPQISVLSDWFVENHRALDTLARLIQEQALSRLRREFPTFLALQAEVVQRTLHEAFIKMNVLPISTESEQLSGAFFEFVLELAQKGKLDPVFDTGALFRDRAHLLLRQRTKHDASEGGVCLVGIDNRLLWMEECSNVLGTLPRTTMCEVFYTRRGELGVVHRASCEAGFLSELVDGIGKKE